MLEKKNQPAIIESMKNDSLEKTIEEHFPASDPNVHVGSVSKFKVTFEGRDRSSVSRTCEKILFASDQNDAVARFWTLHANGEIVQEVHHISKITELR